VHAAAQTPWLQNGVEPLQVTPQAPQFDASVVASTHAPAHAIVPFGHVQRPLVHDWDSAQIALQAPQSWTSVARSTQPPLHVVSPGLHADEQDPTLHRGVCPAHASPQAPQFVGSERRGAHAAPHATSPWSRQTGAEAPSTPSTLLVAPGKSSDFVPPQAEAITAATRVTIAA
jgi:hypothetical protein